jgi:septin family protein
MNYCNILSATICPVTFFQSPFRRGILKFYLLEHLSARKTILEIGPTGVGKSLIGNALLDLMSSHDRFISSAGVESVTTKIRSIQKNVSLAGEANQFQLTVVDTPGIMDTKGKSIEYLDNIIEYIRSHTINMIVIVHVKGK